MRTPYEPSIHLKKNRGSLVAQFEYAKIIGSVMFLMNCTHLDVAYSVSRLRIRLDTAENWNTVLKIIFKCVNSTMKPIFNEKVAEKWNLWVCEQCIGALFMLKSQQNQLLKQESKNAKHNAGNAYPNCT